MKTLKSIIKLTMILLLTLVIYSCSKDDNTPIVPDSVEETPQPEDTPEAPAPALGEITPLTGPKMTVVTINGENFSTDTQEVKVFFNEKVADVQELLENKITAIVPARAYSGPIAVELRDTTLVGPEFNYIVSDTLVSTLAGSEEGDVDGVGSDAQFNRPTKLAVDSDANVYVADALNHKIKKIAPDGMVSTFAGGTKGDVNASALQAQFDTPYGIAIDAQGVMYVADTGNHKIKKVGLDGTVSTLAGSTEGLADGIGADAQFNAPRALTVDKNGIVYVADTGNGRVRKITPNGSVTTLDYTMFSGPSGVALDKNGSLYVADSNNQIIWIIFESGAIEAFAGIDSIGDVDGNSNEAQFRYPRDIAVDDLGNVYVADEGNSKIRKITPQRMVTTLAGGSQGYQDGNSSEAQFRLPYGIAVDKDGIIYLADTVNNRIRKITQE